MFAQAETPSSSPTLRKDTRLYLSNSPCPRNAGRCIGIVWMCNPGTTKGINPWGPCPLPLDPTLTRVGNILKDADGIARSHGYKGVQNEDYLQILNLHYVVTTSISGGFRAASSMVPTYTETPHQHARFCWLAWGEDVLQPYVWNALDMLKNFPSIPYFYYDKPNSQIIPGPPIHPSYPSHPLVLTGGHSKCISSHIAQYLK